MRLIDADALLAKLHQYDDNCDFKCEFEYGLQQRLDTCIDAVEDAPTVDAVEVVRCRDCKYWDTIPGSTFAPMHHQCKETRLMTTGTWYCALGKRKDGDHAEGKDG